MATVTLKCPRCSGNGLIESFMHVRSGVCFRCKGDGVIGLPVRVSGGHVCVGNYRFNYTQLGRKALISQAARVLQALGTTRGVKGELLVELATILTFAPVDVYNRGVLALLPLGLKSSEMTEFDAVLTRLAALRGKKTLCRAA